MNFLKSEKYLTLYDGILNKAVLVRTISIIFIKAGSSLKNQKYYLWCFFFVLRLINRNSICTKICSREPFQYVQY